MTLVRRTAAMAALTALACVGCAGGVRAIGSAEPYSTVDIRSQITGQLIKVNFREGEEVTRGQVLFEIDRRPLEAAVLQAVAG